VAVIPKWDLARTVEFDVSGAESNVQAVRPGMEIFKLSAKTGEGLAECMEFLKRRQSHFRKAVAAYK